VTAGAYTLSAEATDEFGVSSASTPVTITVVATGLPAFDNAAVLTNGQFAIRMSASANQTLIIQASTNLAGWTAIATNSAAKGVIDFIDTNAVNFHHRFYRAINKP